MGSTKSKNSRSAVIEKISTLNILPNECLILILRYLDISDLTAVANCSSRFRYLARHVFFRRYKRGRMFMWNPVDRAALIFGDLIRSVYSIPDHRQYLNEVNLIAINQYFPNLRKLDCIIKNVEILLCSVWEELIPRLVILKLCVALTSSNQFDYERINTWSNLVMLEIDIFQLPLEEIFRKLHCTSIKHLKLHGNISDAAVFEEFALRNTQLNGLSLFITNNTDTVHLAGIKYFQNLEMLKIFYNFDNTSHHNRAQTVNSFSLLYNELAEIHSLRKLHLLRSFYADSIRNIKQLKVLHMPEVCNVEFYGDRLVPLANSMPDLEELCILLGWSEAELIYTLIENAPQLKLLYLVGNGLDNNKYMRLVKICKNQKRKLQIVCQSKYSINQVQALHEKFSHVVQLSEKTFPLNELDIVEHEILNPSCNSL